MGVEKEFDEMEIQREGIVLTLKGKKSPAYIESFGKGLKERYGKIEREIFGGVDTRQVYFGNRGPS